MPEQMSIRGRCARWTALAVLVALVGCKSAPRMPVAEIDSDVREYVRIAAALGQRDADSLDYYYETNSGDADTQKEPPSLSSLKVSALSLIRKVKRELSSQNHDTARENYLLAQLRAIVSRADVLMAVPTTFDEEMQSSFGVRLPASYDHRSIGRVQAELQAVLPGKGLLADRYQAFDETFVISPSLVPAVIEKAVEECRRETLAHIALPAGEKVTIEYVRNRPWSAFSWYKGHYHSVIQINMDFGLTVDRALNLACHEAYPGHHTYNSIREAELVKGRGLEEYTVQPTYSPQSMMSESMATLAVDVAFPAAKRLVIERDVLFPLAGKDVRLAARYLQVEALVDQLHTVEPEIAREYLDGQLEFERAGGQLQSAALMAHPEAALKYINEYRSYVTTYTYGRDLVADLIQKRSGEDSSARWRTYTGLMVEPSEQFVTNRDSVRVAPLSRAGGG